MGPVSWPGFNTPGSAWLFLLLVPLIAFYFLKLKRPRLKIPSLVLWQAVLNDRRVNSPFQRFKRNLLLLLQILILSLVVLAAMQPFLRRAERRRLRIPVLIDNSASMGALDKPGGESRLDAAKKVARSMIDNLLPDQELALISFAGTAQRRTGFTNDRRLLREALARIDVADVPSDLDEALQLAQALARTAPFDEVLILSDGNMPGRANLDLAFDANYQRVPPAGANVGITSFNARRGTAGGWDVYLQLESAGDDAPGGTLELMADEAPLESERILLNSEGTQRLVFRVPGDKPLNLEARLVADGFDSLAADNIAWLKLPESRPIRVSVPEGMASYRHALNVLENVRVSADPEGADLLLTKDSAPAPARVTLYVGVVPGDLKDEVTIRENAVDVVDWRRESPILQHVQLGDLVIMDDPVASEAIRQEGFASRGYTTLIDGPHGPLALQKVEGDRTAIYLLFDTDRSTLPYRVGFPVFVANVANLAAAEAGIAQVEPQRTVGSMQVGDGASLLSGAETTLGVTDEIAFDEDLKISVATAPVQTERPLWWALALGGFAVMLVEWWMFQRRPGGVAG